MSLQLIKAVFVLLTIIGLMLTLACESRRTRLMAEGNKIIAKIEAFKQTSGHLPPSLKDINVAEKLEGPIFYEKKTETSYIVWFGEELGESVTYDSETKKWASHN